MGGAKKERPFVFEARLERFERGTAFYGVTIPAVVSRAIDVRGPVPIVAHVTGADEAEATVHASLMPVGRGRHMLLLNAAARRMARAEVGTRLSFELSVDHAPTVDPVPEDLLVALRAVDAEATFAAFPVGRQNHILRWVEEAVHQATRERRIARTVEVTLAARDEGKDTRRPRRTRK